MLAMPWFVANMATILRYKLRNNDALGCREVDDGERRCVLDRVVERPSALVERCPILRKALSEPNEIWDAVRKEE